MLLHLNGILQLLNFKRRNLHTSIMLSCIPNLMFFQRFQAGRLILDIITNVIMVQFGLIQADPNG